MGQFVFFLVAALVFAGLGWVTVAALRVEQAQREAAARAELGNNLRVALWKLDSRMLPALGVEDSRPFYHYASPDPLTNSTAGPTPLLAAPLPDWMKLHVQLDPANGWDSPQVLTPDAAGRVALAWPELPLRNTTADRAAILAALKRKYPTHGTWELLAARERALPADSLPFAAPLFTTDAPLFNGPVSPVPPNSPTPKPPPPPGMGPVTGVAGSPTPAAIADSFQLFGWEFKRCEALSQNTTAATKKEAVVPVPQAGAYPGRGTQLQYPDNDRRLNDYRNRAQTIQRAMEESKNAGLDFPMYGKGYPPNAVPLPAPATPPTPVPGAAPPIPGSTNTKGGKGQASVPGVDKQKPVAENGKRATETDTLKRLRAEQLRGSLTENLAILRGSANIAVPVARPVPPAEDRPPVRPAASPPPVNIHLGSMRPQWITAPDGTETLVLVRAAKLDAKTVYQGVVLDWAKLEQVLLDEVRDLFPEASLVPVKDPAGVSPDRAMTALPVQLDPGPAAPLPPTGWTLLRVGLVLAWVAALVAFAAVGLSGWSLIDLAERRIRFVSAVTHELRTPLTSLRLYLDLLMSGMITDEAKRQEYLNTLATESDRLHRLIDNVLDFAKLEKRRANGDMKPVRVADLSEQLRQTWADRVAADGKQLLVVSMLPPEAEVCTDAAMVQQIVGNLIDNARKYTRDATDSRIWLRAVPGASGRIAFEVEDRGAGVPVAERKSIFKPFRRGAHADTTAGGAGLGLALAKQWAEVLGGVLTYRPADGAPGACFRLELPAKL